MALSRGYKTWKIKGRMRLEHRLIYERHFGPVPPGYDVHHKDGDRLNNDLSNLELLSKLDHARIHAGWKSIDGEWLKPCSRCGGFKPLAAFHKRPNNNGSAYCKPCHAADCREYYAKAKTE